MQDQLQLFDGLSLYEGSDVEYKGAQGGLPASLWESYVAFANTEGGTIWLGVSQRGESLDIHGIKDAERLVADFWNTVKNRSKVSRNLLANENVAIHLLPSGQKLVLIEVPRASRRERPVFLGSDPFRGTYRRNFEGDYLCTDEEVRRMFADQADEPPDSRLMEGFAYDDVHEESFRQFRNRFASRAPDHPFLSQDDRGLLERLGGWRRDRQSGQEGLTLAGLLMFGKGIAIIDPAGLPGFHLDYRERFSDDTDIRWTDRLTIDGTWEGNLFQFYQSVVIKLGSGPGLKRPFQRDEQGYRQSETPVHEALKEALVNSMIHADYSGQGGIVIDRYLDRFEFSNPGTLLVSREQILRGGVSECRNKYLQRMFQMLGVGDKAGSGIDKIRSSWAAQHWRSPSLQETFRPDRVRLILPLVSLLPDELLQLLKERFGSTVVDNLTRDELQVIATAASEDRVSNQRLQEMLPLHRVEITKLLKELCRRGLLEAHGVGRGTRYSLANPSGTSKFVEGEEQVIPPKLDSSPPNTQFIPPSTTDIPPREAGSEDLDAELLEIARPVRGSARATPAIVTSTILQLCSDRYLTGRQLAELMGRKRDKLLEDYLTPMVRRGDLAMLYPDTPRHRQQAYRKRQQ